MWNTVHLYSFANDFKMITRRAYVCLRARACVSSRRLREVIYRALATVLLRERYVILIQVIKLVKFCVTYRRKLIISWQTVARRKTRRNRATRGHDLPTIVFLVSAWPALKKKKKKKKPHQRDHRSSLGRKAGRGTNEEGLPQRYRFGKRRVFRNSRVSRI